MLDDRTARATVTAVMGSGGAERPPKTLNQKSAIRLLTEHGWTRTLGGRHNVKMVKPESRPVTLPHHQGHDYSPDLRSAILKQAGII